MAYPVSAPFSFTDVPDFVFDQVLTFATMTIMLNNERNIGSSFDIEHNFADGLHDIVSASYKFTKGGSANLALAASTSEIIDFDAKIFDDGGTDRVTTGASWKFTADRDMKVKVSAHLHLEDNSGWAAGEIATLLVRLYNSGGTLRNDGTKVLDLIEGEASVTRELHLTGTAFLSMNSGDYFSIYGHQNSTPSWVIDDTLTTSSIVYLATYIEINEVFPGA